MEIIEGDLIKLAKDKKFNVIVHGCNCFCAMGAGIAVQMAHAFGCDNYPMEDIKYRGDVNKLGTIDYQYVPSLDLIVVNAYTQYLLGKNLSYQALYLTLFKINNLFSGKIIGLPQIGCGIAGGIWDINEISEGGNSIQMDVKTLIETTLVDCQPIIVKFKKETDYVSRQNRHQRKTS